VKVLGSNHSTTKKKKKKKKTERGRERKRKLVLGSVIGKLNAKDVFSTKIL
jgi:hypothetical protein